MGHWSRYIAAGVLMMLHAGAQAATALGVKRDGRWRWLAVLLRGDSDCTPWGLRRCC